MNTAQEEESEPTPRSTLKPAFFLKTPEKLGAASDITWQTRFKKQKESTESLLSVHFVWSFSAAPPPPPRGVNRHCGESMRGEKNELPLQRTRGFEVTESIVRFHLIYGFGYRTVPNFYGGRRAFCFIECVQMSLKTHKHTRALSSMFCLWACTFFIQGRSSNFDPRVRPSGSAAGYSDEPFCFFDSLRQRASERARVHASCGSQPRSRIPVNSPWLLWSCLTYYSGHVHIFRLAAAQEQATQRCSKCTDTYRGRCHIDPSSIVWFFRQTKRHQTWNRAPRNLARLFSNRFPTATFGRADRLAST